MIIIGDARVRFVACSWYRVDTKQEEVFTFVKIGEIGCWDDSS